MKFVTLASVYLSAVLIGAQSIPASADPSALVNDSKLIQQCIETATSKAAFASNCIGIVADRCAKAAANRAPEPKACAARELTIWNARLQSALDAIKKGGFPKIVASVNAAQKAWAGSIDQLCPIFDQIDPIAPLEASQFCRLQETARRVLILEHIGTSVSEH